MWHDADWNVSVVVASVVETIQRGRFNKQRQVNMVSDLQQVSTSCLQLQDMLQTVIAYVDDVIVSNRTFLLTMLIWSLTDFSTTSE